jgi:transcriptional regulator with XRE-family HTH domain
MNAPIKALVDRICDRHEVTQKDIAAELDVSYATLKNWMKGSTRCPKTAQIALEAWSENPINHPGAGVLAFSDLVLTAYEELQLSDAWLFVIDDDNRGGTFLDYIKDWSDDKILDFIQEAPCAWFADVVRAQLIDNETGQPAFELPDSSFKALVECAKEEARPVAAKELADRYVRALRE